MPRSLCSRFLAAALFAALAVLFVVAAPAVADDSNHKYAEKDEVTVWVNRVGPYPNPQETYSYWSLPLCRPDTGKPLRHKKSSLAVLLEGDQVSDSGISVAFNVPTAKSPLCTFTLDADSAAQLSKLVAREYWYQLYVDELPVWGMVGSVTDGATYVYTHKHFSIAANGPRIIEVNLTSSAPQRIAPGVSLAMTYSVQWSATDKSFSRRFDRYLDLDFFEHYVHWLALLNSVVMVLFLCSVVALILYRTLRSDFARHALSEDNLDLEDVIDESGWKQVHNDVLRPPRALALLAGLVGSGAQLLALCLLTAAVVGTTGALYDERGGMLMTALALFCVSAVIGGFVSGRLYKQSSDPRRAAGWKGALLYTATLLPALALLVQSALNAVAVAYGSQAALDTATMLRLLGLWLGVQCPLTLLGTVVGRALTAQAQQRYSFTLRPIPLLPLRSQAWVTAMVAASMPFAAVFIEIHFIFTSIWSYKFYYVYGFMFAVFAVMVVVTLCVAVLATYVTLNREDWRWQWMAAAIGLFMAAYVFLYAVYYFVMKTRMTGVLQTCYYFGYVALFCAAVGALTAGVAFLGARWFVNRIYQTKTD